MASKGLDGFTPQLRRLLEAAGVDLEGGGLAARPQVWGSNLAPSAAEQAGSSWYRLRKATGVNPSGWLNDAGNPAIVAAQARRKQGVLDPSVAKLLDQVNAARAVEAGRGGPDTRQKPSLLLRALDYIGRPGAGVMGAITEAARAQDRNAAGGSQADLPDPGDLLSALGRGFGRGFTAKERYHGSKLLDEQTDMGRVGRGAAGFALDVAVDPLSYLTFGVGKAVAAPGQATAAATRAGADAAVASGARQSADDLARVLSGPRSKVPMTPRVRAERMNRAVQAIDTAAADVGRQAARAASVAGAPPTVLSAVRQQAAETTARELTELAQANMAQQIRRSLTVKAGGLRLASVPIPAGVTAASRAVASMPLAEKAIATFGRTFDTGSRFDRVLTSAKARSAGRAEQRIEAARDDLITQFRGTAKDQRVAAMEALATGGPGFGAGIARTATGSDVADVIKDAFDHVGRYVDWDGTGSAILSVDDLNRFLPKRYKFDKTAVPKGTPGGPADRMAALVQRNGDYLRNVDPAQYLYALHIATEKAVARDQLARAVSVFGVPATGTRSWSRAGQELASKHGYAPLRAGGRDSDVGAGYARHFDGLVFDPDVRHGVTKLLAVADNAATRGEVMRLYDRSLSGLKKALTLPNPSFHLRNSFGDVFLGYLDDVSGPRGLRSYEQATRTMTAIHSLGKQPNLRAVLDAAVDPASGAAPDPIKALAAAVSAGRRPPGPGARVMRVPRSGWKDAPGDWLTAEQLWAAYNHAGLKRGFVSADLEQQLSTRAVRPVGAAVDKLTDVSAAREDYFRMAHFIDRIKRSKAGSFSEASEEAAHYVRKFHFDYHDVTPTEQAAFARIFPFYKFQRFAAPLMMQMFFARPGKILNAQRGLYGISDAAGYERDDMGLPAADQVLPEYFRDAAMFPLYASARGNTVWANPGLPSTSITSQTLGLAGDTPGGVATGIGRNLVGSVNPMVQAPFELATGRRVFGGGDIPTGPLPEYLAGKTPLTNLAFVGSGKDDAATRWSSWATGLGLSENTPSRQRGALLEELKRISANRKKDGFTPPKGRSGRSDTRRDTRGG